MPAIAVTVFALAVGFTIVATARGDRSARIAPVPGQAQELCLFSNEWHRLEPLAADGFFRRCMT